MQHNQSIRLIYMSIPKYGTTLNIFERVKLINHNEVNRHIAKNTPLTPDNAADKSITMTGHSALVSPRSLLMLYYMK